MQRKNSPTPIASLYDDNDTPGQAQMSWPASARMVNTGCKDTIFTSNTGGSQGHTHPISMKKLNMYGWIRTV